MAKEPISTRGQNNMYALLKIRTSKYINTDRTKGKIKKYTIIISNFSSSLNATD